MKILQWVVDSIFIWCVIVVTSTAYDNFWVTFASGVAAVAYTLFTYWTGLHKGANL